MKVTLGDVAELINGDRGKNYPSQNDITDRGEVAFVNAGHLSEGKVSFENMNYITKEKYDCLSSGKFKQGDILYCLRGSLGKKALICEKMEGAVASSLVIIRLIDKNVLAEYLMLVLDSPTIKEQLVKANNGSSQPNLSAASVKGYSFEVPSIQEQKEIVEELNLVKSIIDNKKRVLSELDNLIKSRFVEMFGDRFLNDKQWDTQKLGNCMRFNNGKAHEQVVDENGEYILITSRAIASDLHDVRRTNTLLFPLHRNDIVMVMSDVPNGRALAKCLLIDSDEKYTLNQRICSFNNYEFEPVFLLYLLNRHQYFLDFNDGNGQTNLRKNDIMECDLIVPPIELQREFAAFVRQVDKLKFWNTKNYRYTI